MTETSAIYLIGGIAFVLAARWIYLTAAGKKGRAAAAATEVRVRLPRQRMYLISQNASVCNNLKITKF
jgi:hypothetical protein